MISCPGDVIKERELLKKCVEMINKEREDDWVELQYWVTDTFSDAGMEAQDSINRQLVEDSDGLIAIFNARLGTPTRDYKCGTDEEIALMLEAKKHVSLLFNNKPTIDLTSPSSIEQISKLQEYKKEQSKRAYYREFDDDDSFINLAMREIRLWLRNITNTVQKNADLDNNIPLNDNKIETNTKIETTDKLPAENDNTKIVVPQVTNSDDIDDEAGIIDCVVYITKAAGEMLGEINGFSDCANGLTETTNSFTNKIQYLKSQKNSVSQTLVLLKQFALEIDSNKERSSSILDKMEQKWNEIYKYMLIYDNSALNNEDRIIIHDSISGLKECFDKSLPKINEIIDVFVAIPNYQKDFKKSINGLANVYKKFKTFVIKAIDNCEEIEDLFTIIV